MIAGVVSMRMDEAERISRIMLPGTVGLPCVRCGERVAVTPAMRRTLHDLKQDPWCYECVDETNPDGYRTVVSIETIIEALTLHRLEEALDQTGGPIQ